MCKKHSKKSALLFLGGVLVGYGAAKWLENHVPYSYRQTPQDVISYILTGDLASPSWFLFL